MQADLDRMRLEYERMKEKQDRTGKYGRIRFWDNMAYDWDDDDEEEAE